MSANPDGGAALAPSYPKSLADAVTAAMRVLLGNRCFISGAVAIGGTVAKVKLAAAVDFCIDGQLYHKAITDDLFVHTDLTVQAVSTTKLYALCLDSAGSGSIIAGPADGLSLPIIPDTKCAVGAIKVVTDATHTFTPATTAHNAAGITTTYANISCLGIALPTFA